MKKARLWLLSLLMLILPLAAGLSGCRSTSTADSIRGASEYLLSQQEGGSGQDQASAGKTGRDGSKQPGGQEDEGAAVKEGEAYTTKDEVAAYIHLYGELPLNYLSKAEAESLGWDNRKGNLWDVAPGASIGGSHFGNYEKRLPEKNGRKYYECDINYSGGYRGAERIIYSNDGLIFYTADHYNSFEQLY